jgi:hypothetical protein
LGCGIRDSGLAEVTHTIIHDERCIDQQAQSREDGLEHTAAEIVRGTGPRAGCCVLDALLTPVREAFEQPLGEGESEESVRGCLGEQGGALEARQSLGRLQSLPPGDSAQQLSRVATNRTAEKLRRQILARLSALIMHFETCLFALRVRSRCLSEASARRSA